MSIQREVFRRLRLNWTAVLVIAASSIGGFSLEAGASWFPQDAGVAPVESEAPTTPNADQAAVVEQDDEGSGSSESVDANADPLGVDADVSGDESEGTPTLEDGEMMGVGQRRVRYGDLNEIEQQNLNRRKSQEAKERLKPLWWFVWGYPVFLALWFGGARLFDGKWPTIEKYKFRKVPFILSRAGVVFASVFWLMSVAGLLVITAKMS